MFSIILNLILGALLGVGQFFGALGIQMTAIVLGLYDDLIEFVYSWTELFKDILLFIIGKKTVQEISASFKSISWNIWVFILMGVGIAFFFLAKPVSQLAAAFPNQSAAIIFGIVIASIMVPVKELTSRTWKEWLVLFLSFSFFTVLFTIKIPTTTEVTTEPSLVQFLLDGLIAGVVIFLPVISVPKVLGIINHNQILIDQFNALSQKTATVYTLSAIILFIIGIIIGLIIFSRVLHFIIEKQKSLFVAFIIGLLCASLINVWPFTKDGNLVFPWQYPIALFTEMLLWAVGSYFVISVVRIVFSMQPTRFTESFGKKNRIVVE